MTASARETVRVTFRHTPSAGTVRAFLPGSFNDWGPNIAGFIHPDAPSRMTWADSPGCYVCIVPLVAGSTYDYKFHEHADASGTSYRWITDPLNPRINTADNNNSLITPFEAFLFQISPKDGSVVTDSDARLVFGAFTADSDSVLPDASTIRFDGRDPVSFTDFYDDSLSLVVCPLAGLSGGAHRVVITLQTASGRTTVDSTRFTLLNDDIYFITPSHDDVLAASRTVRFRVGMAHTRVDDVRLEQIDAGAYSLSAGRERDYEVAVTLGFGMNRFVAVATDSSGAVTVSDTLRLYYPEPRYPDPEIRFERTGDGIRVTGRANDPQGDPVTYAWANQPLNPERIPGIGGIRDSTFTISVPVLPGDYALRLVATDPDGHAGQTVNFFTVRPDGGVLIPGPADVPAWVRDAQIYCLFVRSFTAEGTLRAAAERLDHIRDMGFGVIWLLPVMDVEGELDRRWNIGYNIRDFYRVEPVYGTEADFSHFVRSAHDLGLRVILDVTPSHSSRSHPIALDARANGPFSRYHDFYQHAIIPHNDNGLGQSVSSDGIVYYSAFSDALLNWDWENAESRRYMLDVYTHWLREYDIDGFRFDVYWGSHRRYGVHHFDRPLREALRRAKADILLLGETDGTGIGTESQYADRGGGMDLGYDWRFKDAILRYPSIHQLDDRLYNAGYRPGPNSYFLRFLENQDEDRVAYRYGSIERTLPVSAALFTATGIPMIYQGQETGMGQGMGGDKDHRARAIVDWANPAAGVLAPHYQKLAQIRAQFPAFRRQFEDLDGNGRIDGGDPSVQVPLDVSDPSVYAFGRPFPNQNGLVVINFSANPKTVSVLTVRDSWCEFDPPIRADDACFLNNLYENASVRVSGRELDTLRIPLEPYGAAVYTISLREERVALPDLRVRVPRQDAAQRPGRFRLYPAYPNPFNAMTVIRYDLPVEGAVSVEIFDAAGRRIRRLAESRQTPGTHVVRWDGRDGTGRPAPSGLYLCRVRCGSLVGSGKIVLMR